MTKIFPHKHQFRFCYWHIYSQNVNNVFRIQISKRNAGVNWYFFRIGWLFRCLRYHTVRAGKKAKPRRQRENCKCGKNRKGFEQIFSGFLVFNFELRGELESTVSGQKSPASKGRVKCHSERRIRGLDPIMAFSTLDACYPLNWNHWKHDGIIFLVALS